MLGSICILIVLIAINGIFSASELAFLSIDKIELKEELKKNNKKAKKIEKILSNPSAFLSTIQIGITLAGFFASAFAADYFANYFLDIIKVTVISRATLKTILVVIITIVLSYLTLVFGELVPKKIAINNPLKISYMFIGLISFVNTLCYPIVNLLSFSTEIICKIFRIKDKPDKLTEEDIKKMIILGKDEGIVEEKEKDYILNVFNFNDVEVKNVMTSVENVKMLDVNDELIKIITYIKEYKYTRFPVYDGNKDNIIGILNVKDLIMQHKNISNLKLRDLLRKVVKFEVTEKIDDVFRMMQENKQSIAVVYDKEKFVGLVTIEDAVEEIVGNIYDEFDGK